MYSASFVYTENLESVTYVLGTANNIVFDISDLSGNDIDLGLSQGTSQVGQTVDRMSVNGNTLTIKGVIYSNIQNGKSALRHAFAPFREGVLYFGDYFINVVVKHSPTFTPIKNRGSFSLQLFAPYPFWRKTTATTLNVTSSSTTSRAFRNDGDLEVPYTSLTMTASASVTNPTLYNDAANLEKIKFNTTLPANGTITVTRDKNNVIQASMTASGTTTDALGLIDQSSDFWNVHIGVNSLYTSDYRIKYTISMNEAVGGVYET